MSGAYGTVTNPWWTALVNSTEGSQGDLDTPFTLKGLSLTFQYGSQGFALTDQAETMYMSYSDGEFVKELGISAPVVYINSNDVHGHIDLNGFGTDGVNIRGIGGNLLLYVDPANKIIVENLPTSDPHVLNALWNDAGAIKISAG